MTSFQAQGGSTTTWTISAATDRVDLDQARHAEATFTVTNQGPVDQRLVLEVVTEPPQNKAWFTVVEPQVLVPHGRSHTFLVKLDVPAGTPAGTQWFAARAYSADRAPEETSVVSDRVAVEITPSQPPPPWWKRWWWVFVVAGLALVTLVVVLILVLGGDDEPPVATQPPAEPELTVRKTLQLAIQATNPVDFDEIVQGAPSDRNEIQFVASASDAPRSIQPVNGAAILKIPATDRPGEECARASLRTDQIGVDDWRPGEVLCVRTGDGRLASAVLVSRFAIAGRGPVLNLDVTTFEVR